MASKLVPKDFLGRAVALLKKITKPWEVTGPTASPEFLESQPLALDYRKFAPATAPARAIVPHAQTDRVYDIKYYPRDRRRHVVVTDEFVQPASLVAEVAEGLPPTPGKLWIMGKVCDLNDTPGDGYVK